MLHKLYSNDLIDNDVLAFKRFVKTYENCPGIIYAMIDDWDGDNIVILFDKEKYNKSLPDKFEHFYISLFDAYEEARRLNNNLQGLQNLEGYSLDNKNVSSLVAAREFFQNKIDEYTVLEHNKMLAVLENFKNQYGNHPGIIELSIDSWTGDEIVLVFDDNFDFSDVPKEFERVVIRHFDVNAQQRLFKSLIDEIIKAGGDFEFVNNKSIKAMYDHWFEIIEKYKAKNGY